MELVILIAKILLVATPLGAAWFVGPPPKPGQGFPAFGELKDPINRRFAVARVRIYASIGLWLVTVLGLLFRWPTIGWFDPGTTAKASAIGFALAFLIAVVATAIVSIRNARKRLGSHEVYEGCIVSINNVVVLFIFMVLELAICGEISYLLASKSRNFPLLIGLAVACPVLVVLLRLYIQWSVRRIGKRTVARPDWQDALADVSNRTNVKLKQAYIVPYATANASVMPNGTVVVTKPAALALTQAELLAILAHEISHLKDRDIRKMQLARALAMTPLVITYALGLLPPRTHDHLLWTVAALCCCLPLMMSLSNACTGLVSRKMEFKCDQFAASHFPAEDFASALIKICRINGVPPEWPGGSGWLLTHPSTADRLRKLGIDWRNVPAWSEPIVTQVSATPI